MKHLSKQLISTGTSMVQYFGLNNISLVSWLTFLNKIEENTHKSEIQQSVASGKAFKSLEKLKSEISLLESKQQFLLIALIRVFSNSVVDRREKRLLERNFEMLEGELSLDKSQIKSSEKLISQQISNESQSIEIKNPINISVFIFDYSLRWIFLALFFYLNPFDQVYLWLANVVVITGISILFGYYTNSQIEKHNRAIFKQSSLGQNVKLAKSVKSWQYMLCVMFYTSGGYIAYLLTADNPTNSFVAFISTSFGLLILYAFLYNVLSTGKIREEDLPEQLLEQNANEELSADNNDRVIIGLESNLKSIKDRLDTYVLESALFGALAFSGFLQIMAENLINFNDLEKFSQNIHLISVQVVTFTTIDQTILAELGNKTSLFCLISFETLLCSVLFLAVIATRLKFSDYMDKISESLSLAHNLNNKEEELLKYGEIKEGAAERYKYIHHSIEDQLTSTKYFMDKISPISNHMRFFRNGGIMSFYIILISSSLFISKAIGLIFVLIGLVSIVYFNYKKIITLLQASVLVMQRFFINYGKISKIIGLSLVLLSLIMTIQFRYDNMDIVLTLGLLVTIISHVISDVLIQKNDVNFDDPDRFKKEWKTFTALWVIFELIVAIGTSFKLNGMVGSNEILSIGLFSLSIIMFFISLKLTTKLWLGIFLGFICFFGINSVFFKLLSLSGAQGLGVLTLVLLPILVLVVVFRKNWIHQSLLRFLFIVLFLASLVATNLLGIIRFSYAFRESNLNNVVRGGNDLSTLYDLYDKAPLYHDYDSIESEIYKVIENTKWLTSTYPEIKHAKVYRSTFFMINASIWELIELHENNNQIINSCIKLMHANQLLLDKGIRIDDLFVFPYLQKLIELGRKKDVESFIQKAIKICKDGKDCDDEVIKQLEAML